MLEKEWNNLKDGTKIRCKIDNDCLEVWWHDYYCDGEKIMCLCSDRSIWPAWQFDPEDWEIVK